LSIFNIKTWLMLISLKVGAGKNAQGVG